jgi:phenylpropionate dioxygenase-like ring-hydroxylating dioxygenase large terminal subunit
MPTKMVPTGRARLAKDMGLALPDKLEDEKLMWGLVTRYGFYCNKEDGILLDRFRKKPTSENLRQEADEIRKGETAYKASSDPDDSASDPAPLESNGEESL